MELLRDFLTGLLIFIVSFGFLYDALMMHKEVLCLVIGKRHPAEWVTKNNTAILPFVNARELCKSLGHRWQEIITRNFAVYIDGKHSGQVSMSVQG